LQLEIIERQIIEETLKVNEERIDSILGSIEDVVWSMHPTATQFIYFNAAVEKIYGYPISNFFEDPEFWLKVIHVEDRDRIEAANLSIMTTGTVSEEYRILRPDQEVRWVSDRRYLVYDRDGKVIRIDGIVRDITDHKRAQDQLSMTLSMTHLQDYQIAICLWIVSSKRLNIATDIPNICLR
ncbi:MAG: PAS domain-containing protein, partial [Pseudanabaena sp.]